MNAPAAHVDPARLAMVAAILGTVPPEARGTTVAVIRAWLRAALSAADLVRRDATQTVAAEAMARAATRTLLQDDVGEKRPFSADDQINALSGLWFCANPHDIAEGLSISRGDIACALADLEAAGVALEAPATDRSRGAPADAPTVEALRTLAVDVADELARMDINVAPEHEKMNERVAALRVTLTGICSRRVTAERVLNLGEDLAAVASVAVSAAVVERETLAMLPPSNHERYWLSQINCARRFLALADRAYSMAIAASDRDASLGGNVVVTFGTRLPSLDAGSK